MDDQTVGILATITQEGGTDEVWFNKGDNRYYLETSSMNGGLVLGVIAAITHKWIENLPTGTGAHSVAVNPCNNHVFVPIGSARGIAVFEHADKDKGPEEFDCERACEERCQGEGRGHREWGSR